MDTSTSLLLSLRSNSNGVAWQTLCDLYSPLLNNWLKRYGMSQSDIEDITQEVLMVVVRRIPDFEIEPGKGAFRRWLKTITVNCMRDFWRRNQKKFVAPGGSTFNELIEQLTDPHSGVSRLWKQEYEEQVSIYLLNQVRNQFSKQTYQAFQRFALDGINAETVAQELGMTPNAVFIAKSRVMASLRELGRGLID